MLEELAQTLLLGSLLDELERRAMAYEWVTHWQQGEFHHDIILRVLDPPPELPGAVLVVSTNCNGGQGRTHVPSCCSRVWPTTQRANSAR